MKDAIRIQMMENFTIFVNERAAEHTFSRSRKGLALVQYLIVYQGQVVPRQRLLDELWADDQGVNPENALKTLISRMRTMLNGVSDGLGDCIRAERGGYRWVCPPEMKIDLYEIEDIFTILDRHKDDKQLPQLCSRLMELYTGDLLRNNTQVEWALTRAVSLHNRYIATVNRYVEYLKSQKNYEEIVEVCRRAIDVDPFDDHLHMELMTGLIETKRTSEALVQYRHVVHMYYRYLGVDPSKEMREFYKKIVHAGRDIEFSLEAITEELSRSNQGEGAYVCEYSVFKELFNLQMRNLERLGSTIFLGVVMVETGDVESMDSILQDNIMTSLRDILQENLRRGDTITRFSPTIFALLLPTVNYNTGNMVMERVKRLFYQAHPNSNISYHYLLGPLGGKKVKAEGAAEEARHED